MKIVIVLALVAIVAALGGAGMFMLKRGPAQGRQDRMAWALALRVGLSVALFLFVLLSYLLGWIRPTGLPVG
jgi:predicted small integral membrane protein